MTEHLLAWLRNTENWMSTAIPFLGAFVALMRDYEKSDAVRSFGKQCRDYISLLAYAWLGAIVGGAIAQVNGWSLQTSYIAIACSSVFAKGLVELTWSGIQVFYGVWVKKVKG